jgi:hypothetical protein
MSKTIIFGATAFGIALAAIVWRVNHAPYAAESVFEVKTAPPQAAPLCPWREPDADMKQFFPDANRYEIETRILSGLRVELAERLGRNPTAEENALRENRIYQDSLALGIVLTRRVKGTHGAIELVLAVDPENRVRGLRLQRLREPGAIAAAIQNPEWLRSFVGKSVDNPWKLGDDIPEVSAEARASAGAIVEGVRSLLILLAAASQSNATSPALVPHH